MPNDGENERAVMDEARARRVLGTAVKERGLFDSGWYLSYGFGREDACLDGDFTAEQLEAIAWFMRHFGSKGAADA